MNREVFFEEVAHLSLDPINEEKPRVDLGMSRGWKVLDAGKNLHIFMTRRKAYEAGD